MQEKIILHTNNPIFSFDDLLPIASDESSAEAITSLLPDSYMVQLFNQFCRPITSNNQNKKKNENILYSRESESEK